MQQSLFGSEPKKPKNRPTLVLTKVDEFDIGIRFRQVGAPVRFNAVLGRFRFDFPLAHCQAHLGLSWWLVSATQRSQIEDFARRNGLQFVEEN